MSIAFHFVLGEEKGEHKARETMNQSVDNGSCAV